MIDLINIFAITGCLILVFSAFRKVNINQPLYNACKETLRVLNRQITDTVTQQDYDRLFVLVSDAVQSVEE